uniref:type IV toxin-antitoxin system AbiEi family antitoxin domain-containing protein n=1 Tax=Lentilactobacillus hilgardii TaxID=1588 RepID=UPI00403F27AA
MNQKLTKLFQHYNGLLSTQDARSNGIHPRELLTAKNNDEVFQPKRGFWQSYDYVLDRFDLIQRTYSKAVFSGLSALVLYQATDKFADWYEITLPHKSQSRNVFPFLTIKLTSEPYFTMGISSTETAAGNQVRVYNLERTIIDVWKNKRLDQYEKNQAVLRLLKRPELNYFRLDQYLEEIPGTDTLKEVIGVLNND